MRENWSGKWKKDGKKASGRMARDRDTAGMQTFQLTISPRMAEKEREVSVEQAA